MTSNMGHDTVLAYAAIKDKFATLPAFEPILPTSLLPYLAFILLAASFILTFYFSTLPKSSVPTREVSVAALASVLGGVGVVALFCSAGVYV